MSLLRLACLGLSVSVLWAAAGRAATAPAYERVRELNLVMAAANEAALRLAPYGLIDRIERMADGTFRFRAERCFVAATLEALPADASPPQPGTPTGYRVVLSDPQCD